MSTQVLQNQSLTGFCDCGRRHTSLECALAEQVDATLIAGLFPDRVQRRSLLRRVGAATLLAALAEMLPLGTLRAIAQDRCCRRSQS
jgi:nitrate/nitrite transport system substrate-binding protein